MPPLVIPRRSLLAAAPALLAAPAIARGQTIVDLLNGVAPWWVLRGQGIPASLDFDFANGRYWQAGQAQGSSPANLLTVSRASSGYASDTAGNYTNFGANVARIGAGNGLLVEEARTNLFLQSQAFATTWTATGTTPTNAQGIAPDGTNTATSILEAAVTSPHFVSQTIAIAAGATYSFDLFVKNSVGSRWVAIFVSGASGAAFYHAQPSTGASGTSGASGSYTISGTPTITPMANGWYRMVLTVVTATDTTLTATPRLKQTDNGASNYAGDGTSTVLFWQADAQLGAFITSPIPTTTGAVTRAADVVTAATLPTFGSAFSIVAQGAPNRPTGGNEIILSVDGAASNFLQGFRSSSSSAPSGFYQGGGSGGSLGVTGSSWGQNTVGKLAVAAQSGDQAASFNSSTVVSASIAGTASFAAVHFGSEAPGSAQYWNGYISRAAIWARTRLSNADLQRLTA